MNNSAKAKILIVDDEERILRSLIVLFRSHYQVLSTTDPKEALEIVRREQIHVVISDYRMPVMQGPELLKQIRAISPNTVRILLTGYAERDAIANSVNEGEIFGYISKPWDIEEIRSIVEKAASAALGHK